MTRYGNCHIHATIVKQNSIYKNMGKYFRTMVAALTTLVAMQTAQAQIPEGYYASLKGKKGAELKTAVYEIIKDANVLDYGSGTGHTWDGFYSTDRTADGQVTDRYSNDIRYFGQRGSSVSGMNIEHSFPKSWWGGTQNQAYKDLYNLMPCEQKINSSKSNYPMGKVTTVKTDNGCTRIGTGNNGYQLWEPADKWKGDFARGYMYMATAYQNLSWSGTQALQILQKGDYPTLQKWAYTLYMEWARTDGVDKQEVERNDAVCQIQGNRNPFVDFPNLMEYIWGDSIAYGFNPETTVCTSVYSGGGGGTTPEPTEVIIYEALFTEQTGDCVTQNIETPYDGFNIWKLDSQYGWKGSGFANNTSYDTEATLTTPTIDLNGCSQATLSFEHAVNYCSNPSAMLSVEVVCNGQTTTLSGFTWPAGNNWTFKESGNISLDNYAGKNINVVFRYRSTSAQAGTWEIKRMAVKGMKIETGICTPTATTNDAPDFSRPYDTYSLDGKRVTDTGKGGGIVIIRQDGKTWKIKKN